MSHKWDRLFKAIGEKDTKIMDADLYIHFMSCENYTLLIRGKLCV